MAKIKFLQASENTERDKLKERSTFLMKCFLSRKSSY